jgi:hypothetical protein
MNIFRGAVRRMSILLVLEELGLAIAVFVLFALWLRIPDASALEFSVSILLALVALAAAGVGQSWIILRLADRPCAPRRLLLGALLTLGAVALWFLWSALLDHAHANDLLRAGYWNSRFPHGMRGFFSFPHILLWLGWFWSALSWIGAGILAIFVFDLTAGEHPWRAIFRTLRSLAYWIVLLLGAPTAVLLTGVMVDWTPGHGLKTEMLSLVLRLVVAAAIDAVIVSYLLSLLAELLRISDATAGGTPDDNQPRTVDMP